MNAISVHELGKKFKLFPSPGGRFLEYLSAGRLIRHTDFWALQDITFEIRTGTTLGILGQNGSGKSTLLSILAGVLEPSTGSFAINGKVSAILELGSGFHPEFSGRDNVYMYGSIMGLSKQEVDERFSEIVRFSELGDFIDQPLRTYSSGMVLRLAFSVAVNVNADILIVDEALAVGDAIFQHRCFRKIREMQEAGKTILYVGHDTEAVRNLCTQALLLDGGRIIERGDPNTVVNKYYALITERERTYSEGNLIEHGVIPGEEYETVYDFVRNFSEAQVDCAKGVPPQLQTVEIQSTPRKVIFAHPPSTITFTVIVEHGSLLTFAIGILPGAWKKIPQGVKFDIDILFEGTTENIFSFVLQPKRNIGDRGWHNFILPLEKFSERTVSLVFRTSGSGEDLSYCWSAWGWVSIKKIICEKFSNSNYSSTNIDSITMCTEKKLGKITSLELLDKNGNPKTIFESGEKCIIKIEFLLLANIFDNCSIGFFIKNKYCDVYGTNTRFLGTKFIDRKKGERIIVKFLQSLDLSSGLYSLTGSVSQVHSDSEFQLIDRKEDSIIFKIQSDKKQHGFADLKTELEID